MLEKILHEAWARFITRLRYLETDLDDVGEYNLHSISAISNDLCVPVARFISRTIGPLTLDADTRLNAGLL